jgi:ribosome biogenesis GTPase
MAELESWLAPARTVSFIGSSGVGKSSLANRILGHELQSTQETTAEAKGAPHDDASRAHRGTGRGVLIDNPGVREFGVLEDAAGLASVFADIVSRAEHCRFRDCTHETEPGCAVRAATAAGELSDVRLASYHKLKREVQAAHARQDPALMANAKRRAKSTTRAGRRTPR